MKNKQIIAFFGMIFAIIILAGHLMPVYSHGGHDTPTPTPTPTSHKINICHKSGQNDHYSFNSIDDDSIVNKNYNHCYVVDNGHGDHNGDIIPSFTSHEGCYFAGLNTSKVNWIDNGCSAPTPTPTPTHICRPTPTPTIIVEPTVTPTPGEGGNEITPTPTTEAESTVTPTPTETSDNGVGGDSDNNSDNSVSAPVCNATKPNTPSLLSVETIGSGKVRLIWTAASPVTTYAISYGLYGKDFEYGVTSTGNVTSFEVNALIVGQRYSFVVRAVNDCMPSDPSNSISTGGSVLGISTGGEVLGASTMADTGVVSQTIAMILSAFGSVSLLASRLVKRIK